MYRRSTNCHFGSLWPVLAAQNVRTLTVWVSGSSAQVGTMVKGRESTAPERAVNEGISSMCGLSFIQVYGYEFSFSSELMKPFDRRQHLFEGNPSKSRWAESPLGYYQYIWWLHPPGKYIVRLLSYIWVYFISNQKGKSTSCVVII